MATRKCEVCEKRIDSRGITGHMRTHANGGSVKKPVQYVTDVEVISWRVGYREGFADAKKVA